MHVQPVNGIVMPISVVTPLKARQFKPFMQISLAFGSEAT